MAEAQRRAKDPAQETDSMRGSEERKSVPTRQKWGISYVFLSMGVTSQYKPRLFEFQEEGRDGGVDAWPPGLALI